MSDLEHDLQLRTAKKFEGYGWIVVRQNAGKAYSINGNPIKLAPAGSSDLLVLVPNGEVVLLELKHGDNTLNDNQKRMHVWYNWLGHKVVTAYTDKEIDHAFKDYPKPGYKPIRTLMDQAVKHKQRTPKGYESFEDWLGKEAI
jgi:hypothetical protein